MLENNPLIREEYSCESRQSTQEGITDMQYLQNKKGFTLIEIMVVIVILALLAALVGPKLMGRTDDAKITDARVQIKNIETALKLYKLDNGNYPATEQGLSALVTIPTVGVIPKSYKSEGYLESKKVPKDPWGNEYLYVSPGEHGDYDLFSYGFDGAKGGEGKNADITSWDTK
jgi:general secretion pathway protein G